MKKVMRLMTILKAFLFVFVTVSIASKSLKIIKQSNVINVSIGEEGMTPRIASMNDKYFLISYERFYYPYNNLSMVADIYDTVGNKINTKTITLVTLPNNINSSSLFSQFPSQSQCNYNSNVTIKNNIFYGWILNLNDDWAGNASYQILYPSNYNPNMENNINMSNWTIADKYAGINQSCYIAQYQVSACLENGNFVYVWDNGCYAVGTTNYEYMIYIDQNGNNINTNGKEYIIVPSPPFEIEFILPCRTPYNNTDQCDTFLIIYDKGMIGRLYSISEQGKILQNNVTLNQHIISKESDEIQDAISLSNGLYMILYYEFYKRNEYMNLLFLENKNAIQLAINNESNWNLRIDFPNWVRYLVMKEIKDESNDNMVYICFIYGDGNTEIDGILYQIIRTNHDIVNVQIVGNPFQIYYTADPLEAEMQGIYFGSINKTMMIAWDWENGMLQAIIYTLNVSETVGKSYNIVN